MQTNAALKTYLDNLYTKFDNSYLSSDPLKYVHKFTSPQDREVVGLLASSLAYGRVDSIFASVEKLLSIMDYKPAEFVMSFDCTKDGKLFDEFVHRFTSGRDITCFILVLKNALKMNGSLGALFLKGYDQKDSTIRESLTTFIDTLMGIDMSSVYKSGKKQGVGYLLPSPARGSACKRLNMFLRWMVRRNDGLDFGLWDKVSPAKLIIPLDTHTARISRYIGLTKRKSADWKTAEEVTGNLRKLDPYDPVKYDFALCRLGILKHCNKTFDGDKCRLCDLHHICERSEGTF